MYCGFGLCENTVKISIVFAMFTSTEPENDMTFHDVGDNKS